MDGYHFYKRLKCFVFYIFYMHGFLEQNNKTAL